MRLSSSFPFSSFTRSLVQPCCSRSRCIARKFCTPQRERYRLFRIHSQNSWPLSPGLVQRPSYPRYISPCISFPLVSSVPSLHSPLSTLASSSCCHCRCCSSCSSVSLAPSSVFQLYGYHYYPLSLFRFPASCRPAPSNQPASQPARSRRSFCPVLFHHRWRGGPLQPLCTPSLSVSPVCYRSLSSSSSLACGRSFSLACSRFLSFLSHSFSFPPPLPIGSHRRSILSLAFTSGSNLGPAPVSCFA